MSSEKPRPPKYKPLKGKRKAKAEQSHKAAVRKSLRNGTIG